MSLPFAVEQICEFSQLFDVFEGQGGCLARCVWSWKMIIALVRLTNILFRRGMNSEMPWMGEKASAFLSRMDSSSTSIKSLDRLKYTNQHVLSVVLLDLSMPVLDGGPLSPLSSPLRLLLTFFTSGIGATAEIRAIEASRPDSRPARILALTGMSSLDDKRRAFEAGVDG